MEKTYKVLKIIFFAYIVFIAFMSFYPSPPETPTSDKLNHFIAFLILAVLYRISFQGSYWANFFIAIIYGAFIELVQSFLPYRYAEYADFVADVFGTLCGMFFIFVIELGTIIIKENKK
ncbi:MAG: VanZ family protein [Hydrogenothermus sp.]|nr:MAG: VanZ family protein [Hydrogenothermus sp.]